MTTKETILLCELLETCCVALVFIDQASPEDFALGEDELIKERLKEVISSVHRFFEDSLPTIH